MLRLLIFAIAMLALSGICNGQGKTSFGASRAQDTSFTVGQLKLNAYTGADTNVLITTPNGTVKSIPLSGIGGGVDSSIFVTETHLNDTLRSYPSVFNIWTYGATPHYIDSTDDDTQPIQLAILDVMGFELVGTSGSVDTVRQIRTHAGGTVYTPNGIYNLLGPLKKSVVHRMLNGDVVTKAVNAQLYIPLSPIADRADINPVSIDFRSESMPVTSFETPALSVYRELWTQGANWLSGIDNDGSSYPSILASVIGDGAVGLFPNIVSVRMTDMWLTSKFDSAIGGTQLGGVYFRHALDAQLVDSRIDMYANSVYSFLFNDQTNVVVGAWMPEVGQGTVNGIYRTLITGFKYGAAISEHAVIDNAQIMTNENGIEIQPSHHAIELRKVGLDWNRRMITTGTLPYPQGTTAIISGSISVERFCPNFLYDISDTLNMLYGDLTYTTRELQTGCPAGITGFIVRNGATNITVGPADTPTVTRRNGIPFAVMPNGSVGVGKLASLATLDVTGSNVMAAYFTSTASANMQVVANTSGNFNSNFSLFRAGIGKWFLSNSFANSDRFSIANSLGTEYLTISQSNGAVGISGTTTIANSAITNTTSDNRLGLNTTSPSFTLDVRSANQTVAKFTSTFAGNIIYAFNAPATRNTNVVLQEGDANNWYVANRGSDNAFTVTNSDASGNAQVMTFSQTGRMLLLEKLGSYNGATPTNGQLLIGHTANGTFEKATLTAGTGISVTNGAGSITIATSGDATVTTTSAGTFAPSASGHYVFTGTTSTWTLPSVSGTSGRVMFIKNRGSGTVTINTTASANEIYSNAAVNTYALTAGSAIILVSDNSFYNVE